MDLIVNEKGIYTSIKEGTLESLLKAHFPGCKVAEQVRSLKIEEMR